MDFSGSWWQEAKSALAKPAPTTFEDLGLRFFPRLPVEDKQRRFALWAPLRSLQAAVAKLTQMQKDFNFFGELLPTIIRSAQRVEGLLVGEFGAPILPAIVQNENKEITISRTLCHALLSAGFLGLLQSKEAFGFGDLCFTGLMFTGDVISAERILCQLIYFEYCRRHFDGGKSFPPKDNAVTFKRIALLGAEPRWAEMQQPLVPSLPAGSDASSTASCSIVIDDLHPMEDVPATVQVDFANKQLMIGRLIPSMTQEEVMFSIRPECFVSLILFDTLLAQEAVLMYGARQFCRYSGYLDTFRVTGVADDEGFKAETPEQARLPIIVAIDAIVNMGNQYQNAMLRRDLAKAFAGFCSLPADAVIATGNWGCGAFRGDPILKFVQQLMAVAANDLTASPGVIPVRRVVYCTFKKPQLALQLQAILKRLAANKVSIAEVYAWLMEFAQLDDEGTAPTFADFLRTKLN
jgi:poly(ADP-ribose) glycohydrolase